MILRSLCAAASAAVVLLASVPAAQAGLVSGDPGYVLTMPTTVGLGQNFDTCVEAPGNSMVVVLISASSGPLQSKYGTLGVGLPLLGMWTFFMPPSGEICLPHTNHCDPALIGFTGYFQFGAFGPAPGQVGLSNSQSLTAVESGACDIAPGDFVSFTMGGWGTKCAGGNPGCLRDQWFATAFPNGLLMGDQDGLDGDDHYALLLTSSAAVQAFLPEGGTSSIFSKDDVDVKNGTGGNVSGQLCAAMLTVAFDDVGAFNGMKSQLLHKAGDLHFATGVHSALVGRSVRSVIDWTHKALAGEVSLPVDLDNDGIGDVSLGDLGQALDVFNNNFVDGTINKGHLIID